MHWIDWLIVVIPVVIVLSIAVYSRRYVRGVADFLASGRVAGRYVICVGDMQAALAVVSLISLCEKEYLTGMAVGFWGKLLIPVSIFMSLTGYVVYRFRETKCLSLGQFLEMRYNRSFRIIAAFVRTVADLLSNSIGPAVAARFFIYIVGMPPSFQLFGLEISTFIATMILLLSMSMLVIWSGGRISLLVTDAIQGLMSYPIFVIFAVFVLSEISWSQDIAPVLIDRVPGESFMNPMDISELRDFNMFALVVWIVGSVLNRGAWIGNDTSGSGKNAHEQKMAGILGAWRNGFSYLMMTLLGMFMITVMLADRYSEEARDIRMELVSNVAEETVKDPEMRADLIERISAIPPADHTIGEDSPYSREHNPDIPYLNAAQELLGSTPEGNANFQELRTLYYQMMAPTLLRTKMPVGVMGLFVLLMVMLMLSTDDSRIFNVSSTLIQDVVMPFRKTPLGPKKHLLLLRVMSVVVCIFFLLASVFFAQIDFIMMFVQIMTGLWMGAAGPIMIGGLYTRKGTTTGAFGALIFGSGVSLIGIILQRTWASSVYPYLVQSGNDQMVEGFFNKVNAIFGPYILWEMNPVKFPINSYEIYFLAMVMGMLAYVIGSAVTYREPYNLDRLLHRGEYSEDGKGKVVSPWTWKNAYSKLIGIDEEYTRGDKIIAWSVFAYAFVYQFVLAFVVVAIWNVISPWPIEWWSIYFFVQVIVVGFIVGTISTVWFIVGGVIDLKRLFRDLANRQDNPLDDGWVVGNVSLADAERLGTKEEQEEALREQTEAHMREEED